MKPAPFHYLRAANAAEAARLLSSEPKARLLAGGQSLMPLVIGRLERPQLLIDINRITDLDRIELCDKYVRIGALVRQEQALRSALVREYAAGVAQALAWVANPVVRRRGTVVGNLVTNSPGAQLPAVAIALGAEFVLQRPDRIAVMPADELLGANRQLPADAMVTHVLVPRRGGCTGFYEVARRDGHAPVVSAMVSECRGDWRVGLSGVCATGIACPNTARVIARAYPLTAAIPDLNEALNADLIAPLYSDIHSSARYRRGVAPAVVRRATQALSDLSALA